MILATSVPLLSKRLEFCLPEKILSVPLYCSGGPCSQLCSHVRQNVGDPQETHALASVASAPVKAIE